MALQKTNRFETSVESYDNRGVVFPSSDQALNIPEGTSFNGDIISSCDMKIDGDLVGNLTTTGSLNVGSTCTITGDVHAGDIKISGNIVGDVMSSGTVSISKGGAIKGNVTANGLTAERGTSLVGYCQIGSDEAAIPQSFSKPEYSAPEEQEA